MRPLASGRLQAAGKEINGDEAPSGVAEEEAGGQAKREASKMKKAAAILKAQLSDAQPTLKVGWWAAITLKAGTAPLRCYVGKIEAVDAESMRLTLVDWISGMAAGYDFWVPRRNIESMLLATEEHDLDGFGEHAGGWQTEMGDSWPRSISGSSIRLKR